MVSKDNNKYHYGYQRVKLCHSMGIGITLYRASIGMFNRYKFSIKSKSASFIYLLFLVFQIFVVFSTILYKQIKKKISFKKQNYVLRPVYFLFMVFTNYSYIVW